jgi:hypothetical protein
MDSDPCIDMSNPDWDNIIKMIRDEKKGYVEYTCKKCKVIFISPRYNGKYPLCKKHRLKD